MIYKGFLNEVLDSLQLVNDIFEEQITEESFLLGSLFEMKTDGLCIIINFLGFQIWNSDDDEREHNEETEEYEPLENYLLREAKKILSELKTFNIEDK
jgi:hypothetical protein